ncbi:MAG: TIGR02281 family clan AA aspartic protease [Methylobacter sp.]
MDLKDRYYWTKYNEIMHADDSLPEPIRKPRRRRTLPIFLLYFFLILSFSIYFSDFSRNYIKNLFSTNFELSFKAPPIVIHKPLESPIITQPPVNAPVVAQVPIARPPANVVLHADRDGHFRGTLLVNNVAMPFMIDTGATQTAIPKKMAYAARLPVGKAVQVSTANGFAVAHLTRINSLKIGNLDLRGLEGYINDHLDEVLVGMNTLKLFHITQDRNTLILSAYADELAGLNNSSVEAPVHIAKKTWMKTVTCDQNNEHCKTSYR